jgi:hypothetical protein
MEVRRKTGMIARSFKSVLWVATVGGAALGCYMVSLKVATERADLARVERQIVTAQRDIRSLQTELGTRGRLAQLEDWNANVLALSAPAANQFLPDHLTLARLEQTEPTVEQRSAEVHMAAARTGAPAPAPVAPRAEPARPAPRDLPLKAPKLIQAAQPTTDSGPPASLIHKASLASLPAAPPARAKTSRLESIASEIGAAARSDRSEKTGRERSAGTR